MSGKCQTHGLQGHIVSLDFIKAVSEVPVASRERDTMAASRILLVLLSISLLALTSAQRANEGKRGNEVEIHGKEYSWATSFKKSAKIQRVGQSERRPY